MPSFTSYSHTYARPDALSGLPSPGRPLPCGLDLVAANKSFVASPLVLGSDAPLEPDGIPWAHIASYALLALRGIIVRRRALAPGHVSQRRLASIGPSRASVSDHRSITTCSGPTSPLNSIALITPLQMNCTYDWQVRIGRDSNNTIHTRIIC